MRFRAQNQRRGLEFPPCWVFGFGLMTFGPFSGFAYESFDFGGFNRDSSPKPDGDQSAIGDHPPYGPRREGQSSGNIVDIYRGSMRVGAPLGECVRVTCIRHRRRVKRGQLKTISYF